MAVHQVSPLTESVYRLGACVNKTVEGMTRLTLEKLGYVRALSAILSDAG